MNKTIIFFLILTSFTLVTYSQTNDNNFKKQYFKAEEHIDLEQYNDAATIFTELIKTNPENANLKFKLGFCLMNASIENKDAINYLQEAVKSVSLEYNYNDYKETSSPIETYFYLAKSLHFDYRFDDAITFFEKFKGYLTDNDAILKKQIDKEIEECNNGKYLIKYPVEMNITNLGGNVNSELDDHSPIFTADESTLIYTSKRKSEINNTIHEDGQYCENIYICHKKDDGNWSEPKSISSNINTNKNIASISLSVDGQEAFLYEDDKGDGNIYVTHLKGDEWTVPEKLPETINSKAKESHASISSDGSTLYFSSNRKGGFGGSDIYMVKRLPNGEWGQAINLGPEINTEYDEESPFIHPDNVTLFFSSKGHNNMGGFDIFFSMNEGEGWMETTNMGYPINTTGDDIFYSPTPDGKRAYYSSKQKEGFGGSDIYLISLPGNEETPLTVFSGEVLLSNGEKPENVVITVTEVESLEKIGTYIPNKKTGKFLFILQPGNIYNVLFESDNNLYYNETIDVTNNQSYNKINKAIVLAPIVIGSSSGSYYISFEKDEAKLTVISENELKNVSRFLKKNPKVIVGIQSLTSEENELYKKRLQLINDSLINNEISKDRITNSNNVETSGKLINIIIREVKPNEITDTTKITNNSNNTTINNNIPVSSTPTVINNKSVINNNTTTSNNNITITNNSTNNNTNDVIKVNGSYIINYVLFDFNKSETDKYKQSLDILSAYLTENKEAKIAIYAYADSIGSYEYNLYLTQKRADFVKNYLTKHGVNKNQIEIHAKSNTKFISKNTSPDSRKYNRRVDFEIIKPGKTKLKIKKVSVPDKYKL